MGQPDFRGSAIHMNNPVEMFRPVARLGVLLSGYALVGLSLLTGFEVITRKFLGFSLQGVDEIGGYILAATSSIGFTWALLQRSHTRVDIFIHRLPTSIRHLANLVAVLALAAAAIFLCHRAWLVVIETIEYRSQASTPLRTPLIWPQSIWLAGFLLFAVVACVMAAHALVLVAKRDYGQLSRHYAPRGAKEEIAEELASYRANEPAPMSTVESSERTRI